jgi:hypothetical protein
MHFTAPRCEVTWIPAWSRSPALRGGALLVELEQALQDRIVGEVGGPPGSRGACAEAIRDQGGGDDSFRPLRDFSKS